MPCDTGMAPCLVSFVPRATPPSFGYPCAFVLVAKSCWLARSSKKFFFSGHFTGQFSVKSSQTQTQRPIPSRHATFFTCVRSRLRPMAKMRSSFIFRQFTDTANVKAVQYLAESNKQLLTMQRHATYWRWTSFVGGSIVAGGSA